ncbi:cation transporter [Bacteroidia bacterium]|nr:cation transporter [Bacteroidia bacterium]
MRQGMMSWIERLFLILLVVAGTTSCGSSKDGGDEEETVETLLPDASSMVTVMTLKPSDFHQELISNGKLNATQFVDLRFESAEPIAAIYVKNGDQVAKGQKLAELATFRLSNKTAQAKDALDKAALELQDVLIGQGYAPADTAKTPPDIMQLARTRSGYSQALSQYQLALYEEEHATLTAPFDGIVANLFAKTFNKASTTDVFCTIIDAHTMEASFTVLESELSLIKTGDKVVVTPFFALPEGVSEGRITEINPLVDANGMVKVKALVSNRGGLFEGMNVRVTASTTLSDRRGVLVVPKEAVVIRSGKQVVFTLVNGKAYWNYVQTGLENATGYVITEGLKEGDVVITSGNINLAHESTVSLINN